MLWLGLLTSTAFVPGWTGASVATGWAVLSITLPFFARGSAPAMPLAWAGLATLAYALVSLAWTPSLPDAGWMLWLLENCIKYISKNAYIQIALTNNSFFKSAWNAFALIIKNAHRFGFTASIGGIFLGFGVLSVAGIISGSVYVFMTNEIALMGVTSPIPTTVVAGIMAACITMLFLSIFSFASDAILQSFLMDEELGFSGNSRP